VHVLIAGKRRATTVIVANQRTRSCLPRLVRAPIVEFPENGLDLRLWAPACERPRRARPHFVFMGRLVGLEGGRPAVARPAAHGGGHARDHRRWPDASGLARKRSGSASGSASIAGFAEAMDRLGTDPELREALGRAGRERVIELYDWEKKVDRTLEIYREAIERYHGRTAAAR
jgi:hypothetical protein